MDTLISSLKISHILRQIMCGIMFFVPFYVFSPETVDNFLSINGNDWSSTKLFVIFAVSACIGTLIYHLEKNILGYTSQLFRLWCSKKAWLYQKIPLLVAGFLVAFSWVFMHKPLDNNNNTIDCLFIALYFIIWVILMVEVFIQYISDEVNNGCCVCSAIKIIITLFVIAALICLAVRGSYDLMFSYVFLLILPLFLITRALNSSGSFKWMVKDTQDMWLLEAKATSSKDGNLNVNQMNDAIAAKNATWADYIHCGQTSALAWILGSLTIKQIGSSTKAHEHLYEPLMLLAIWVLAIEFFCEWHKSQHIKEGLESIKKQ